MTARELADLHARCFITPRPWTEAEFESLLNSKGVKLYGSNEGFLLGRVTAPEAELLTLAVAPTARRSGRGSALLQKFQADAALQGASEMFLEVATNNEPACALYTGAGFIQVGDRPGYYQTPDGKRLDAIVFRKSLIHA
ncbi:MAG: N-acetyltransferase [Dinoroseobacter sp.]|nr:N-acetyltransferase [Dinoroseobacter sp.]